MIKLAIIRHLVGGPLGNLPGFGKKAVIGTELVMCTTELTHALDFSLRQGIAAVAGLGRFIVALEKSAHGLLAGSPAAPKTAPRTAASLGLPIWNGGIRCPRRWPGRRRRA